MVNATEEDTWEEATEALAEQAMRFWREVESPTEDEVKQLFLALARQNGEMIDDLIRFHLAQQNR